MLQTVIPGHNPADVRSQAGKQQFLFDKFAAEFEKIAPVQIVSYDRKKNRATVQILNQTILSNGGKQTKKNLEDIPALVLCGGNFVLSFPIKAGDIGWICAADRDISIFKKTLKLFAPATYEKHRYKDSFYIPNYINGFTFDEATDADALLISSIDGQTKISVKDNNVSITATTVNVNAGAVNLGGVGGALVLTENSTILDSGNNPCTIVSNTVTTRAV